MQYKVLPYGESAFLVKFEDQISVAIHLQVKTLYEQLQKIKLNGILSLIPAYNSLTVVFNPEVLDREFLRVFLTKTEFSSRLKRTRKKIVKVPVCYQKPYALDLQEVSDKTGLTTKEIIKLHTSEPYLVYFLGFAPGFMYLGGLNERLYTPRKETPRVKVEAGSVGLADQQTGIYPLDTPGGWQIIGKTPLALFSKRKASLAKMGDYIQFVSISANEFKKIQKK